MARPFTPKVLTANRLIEGDVVYLGKDGTWTELHSLARLFVDETAANEALITAQSEPDKWVGPYLADAQNVDGKPEPKHFREAFRTKGPSNYLHGKQEVQHV